MLAKINYPKGNHPEMRGNSKNLNRDLISKSITRELIMIQILIMIKETFLLNLLQIKVACIMVLPHKDILKLSKGSKKKILEGIIKHKDIEKHQNRVINLIMNIIQKKTMVMMNLNTIQNLMMMIKKIAYKKIIPK